MRKVRGMIYQPLMNYVSWSAFSWQRVFLCLEGVCKVTRLHGESDARIKKMSLIGIKMRISNCLHGLEVYLKNNSKLHSQSHECSPRVDTVCLG